VARSGLKLFIVMLLVAIVGLSAASLTTLIQTGATALRRERRRAEVSEALERATAAMAERSTPAWLLVPAWPETYYLGEWQVIDEFLAEQATEAIAAHAGEPIHAGFYLVEHDRHLGRAASRAASIESINKESIDSSNKRTSKSRSDAHLAAVNDQVRRAVSEGGPRFAVVEAGSNVLAMRVEPLRDPEGRLVAAAWAVIRLPGPLFQGGQEAVGYRRSAALALSGAGVAFVLFLVLGHLLRLVSADRERLQAVLRRNERLAALGTMLGGVAHEVRNPLAGIRSTAQLWRRGIEPDEASIDLLIAEVDRLDGIVTQLLRFSRSRSLKTAPIDLNAVVAEAARLVEPEARERGVACRVELHPHPPPIEADAEALLQVLRNLTRNALEVVPEGGSIRLATRPARGGREVEAVVADTGPGLDPETRRHLFEPFFTTHADGVGLGLAIAREIALAHGGDLKAEESSPGQGAVFVLTIPAGSAKAAPPVGTEAFELIHDEI